MWPFKKKERAATMADFYRFQGEAILWHAEEDRLFNQWWAQANIYERSDRSFKSFYEYCEKNWAASVPYRRNSATT